MAVSSIALVLPLVRRRASLAFALLLLVLLSAGPARASAQTVVSLTFDDGAVNQLFARDQLFAHRMHGTFYISSGKVASNSYYMTWDQVATLPASGQEVGGHTIHHVKLTAKGIDQGGEICGDRARLVEHGFDPVSFAYPFGQFDSTSQDLALGCGYKTARRTGGLSHTGCKTCKDAESLPPEDPYAVRSNAPHDGPVTLSEFQGYVTQAEDTGGWVPLTFHDICDIPCPGASVGESISPSDFVAFLDWLKTREASGTVVMSVRAAMGLGEVPFPPEPVATPSAPAAAPPAVAADRVTAFSRLRLLTRKHLRGLVVKASMSERGRIRARASVRLGRKTYHFKTKAADALPGAPVTLRLALTRKGLRAVKRALRSHKRVAAAVTITAKDLAGNVHTEARTARLAR